MSVLDVKAKTKSGKLIDIEIQVADNVYFRDRIIYYNDLMFTGQLEGGEEYSKLSQSISIIICDFIMFKDKKNYQSKICYADMENGKIFSDKKEIYIFELPKVRKIKSDKIKKEKAKDSKLIYWLKFIDGVTEEEMQSYARENPVMEKAISRLYHMSDDEAERMIAEGREKQRRDHQAFIDHAATAEERGIEKGIARGIVRGREEGIEKGISQGLQQGKLQTAKVLKQKNIDISIISESTGLSEDEIKML
jgi:predicted transposase/invertase (TIGR01784 family)